MILLKYPDPETCRQALARPAADLGQFRLAVAPILEAVRREGDVAVRRFSEQFDGFSTENPAVTAEEWAAADAALTPVLRAAITRAGQNIRAFHAAQREPEIAVETTPGVVCRRRSVPIDRVGLYIPGGSAPLFSTVLMLGIPAQLAGCRDVVLCTPPDRAGQIHPAILFAARLCGIQKVYKIGGAQAIAAMAYGAGSIQPVYKIFGPGNPWVTAAKQLVSLDGVAIDLPAGPSEVAVIADRQANPAFIAADLLSQAEHGADSQVVLFSDDQGLIEKVMAEVTAQLETLPRREVAAAALQNSRAVLLHNLEQALAYCNDYAPEHLIIQTESPEKWAAGVTNAGSVFLGPFTPESAGDYASGTNHTLPTGGYARAFAGVSLDSFVKKITFQQISPAGLAELGPTIVEMARAEGLEAHARAVETRCWMLDAGCLMLDDGYRMLDDGGLISDEGYLKLGEGGWITGSGSGSLGLRPRDNIAALKPYSSARDEFKGEASVFLDANENSLGSPLAENYHRYPNPPARLRALVAELKQVAPEQVFLGNGSDEAIDLLIRAYCEPGRDNLLLLPPTYGMYAVQANINGVEIRKAPLQPDFQPDMAAIRAATDQRSRIIFLCSPNNPSGNSIDPAFITELLGWFPGLVVLDEAYIDFSDQPSWLGRLQEFPNLVVLQTLSKAWGLAALRVGMAFGSTEVIAVLNKIKYPYNLSTAAVQLAVQALENGRSTFQQRLSVLRQERSRLAAALAELPGVLQVFPSDANFLLVRVNDADVWYQHLAAQGIVVRNRSREMHCENCLRITIGTPQENDHLVRAGLAPAPKNTLPCKN